MAPLGETNRPTISPGAWRAKRMINSPVCLPLRLASLRRVTRAREWTTVGFLIIRPSLCNLATFLREFAREISLISLGSNQILRSPHLRTEAARRFCNLRETGGRKGVRRDSVVQN